MAVIGLKNGDKLEILEEHDFEDYKDERYLHEIIEKSPELVLNELASGNVIVLGSRVRIDGKEIYLLVCDEQGNLIIIELKKGRSPREAIAQLLDYASLIYRRGIDGLLSVLRYNSIEDIFKQFYDEKEDEKFEEFRRNFEKSIRKPWLVLVSYDIGDDVIRMAEWLRSVYGVTVFCVEFDYYKKENKEIFVPRVIGLEEVEIVRDRELSPIKKKYLEFFSEVLEKFKEEVPEATTRRAYPSSFLQIPSGYNSIHFQWDFKGREPHKELRVCLDFEFDDKEKNEKLLEEFKKRKDELEKRIGEKLEFAPHGSKWTRIYTKREIRTIDNAIKDEKIKEWAVETMVKFHRVLKPILDECMSKI